MLAKPSTGGVQSASEALHSVIRISQMMHVYLCEPRTIPHCKTLRKRNIDCYFTI